jgi:hypothetical protein
MTKLFKNVGFMKCNGIVITEKVGWMAHVGGMGKMRNEYKILVGKAKGKRPPW